ncbi:hypothetical protein GUITHDRAFT_143343 [Guillardia theta CCMP2712]|uniref:Uncharacterized protein n=1 Tax=Guillardia theta (strain CCMP2712) TaxID=905079 RepID=L1ITF3_GUITC|nr:hypothetical protein GUITHDRAFT_143343 [Guillardia theta CCMP2712]EKX39546.1 hypothetical protein GUITHDRAFT_143343 [Guillardia theta CCMP2712]|eukprot:XP_005826526.1 hypothetical protein GUITHDRAFT_143343 [Guillardia theta CCMP2712]
MPRPRASKENIQLSIDFAAVLTTANEGKCHCIARHGSLSLFNILSRCVPSAVRHPQMAEESCTSRKAISEPEILKVLEACGMFKRYRHRRAGRIEDDPAGAGMSLFLGRRWRDPSILSDMVVLREGHDWLCSLYPSYKEECSFNSLITTLKEVIEMWTPRNPFLQGRNRIFHSQDESKVSVKRSLVDPPASIQFAVSRAAEFNNFAPPPAKKPRRRQSSGKRSCTSKAEEAVQPASAVEIKPMLGHESSTSLKGTLSAQEQTIRTVEPLEQHKEASQHGSQRSELSSFVEDQDKPLDLFDVLGYQDFDLSPDLHCQTMFDVLAPP